VFVGEMLDTRSTARRLWPYVGAQAGGLLLAAVNPLGFSLLTFPLKVQQKSSVFQNVVEWRSPNFQSGDGIYALLLISLALVILFRARLKWADILPVVAFLALGLFSLRFIAPAAVVLAPALGRAMRPDRPPAPRPPDPAIDQLNRLIGTALALLVGAFAFVSLRGTGLDLSTYPTHAEVWMAANGYFDPALHRVAEQDVVGCYLILLRGSGGSVFIDDRVDMYPVSVSNDYDTLLHGLPSAPEVLSRYNIDTVLWDRHLPLKDILLAHGGWKVAWQDKGWVVLTRIDAPA
jgi:hypothetical protein